MSKCKKSLTTGFFLGLLVCVPGAAGAQSGIGSYCDRGELLGERLVGEWTLLVSRFRVLTSETPFYVGEGGTLVVSIEDAGMEDEIAWTMRGMPQPMPDEIIFRQAGPSEPDWRWDADPNLGLMSSEDAAMLWDCEVIRFPRIVATFQTQSTDGHRIDHTMRMVVYNDELIDGAWRWEGTDGSVVISRVGKISLQLNSP